MRESNRTEVAIVVRLPRELRDALAVQAEAEDRSVASLLRVAARQYLHLAQVQR